MSETKTPKIWRLIDPEGDQILLTIEDTDAGQIGSYGVQLAFYGDGYDFGFVDFEFDLSDAGKSAARLFFSEITDDRCRELRDEWRERKEAE